jgi:methyl-accepting chemotaxis protein
MDKVTQQNAANAEESASASQELNNQASLLKNVVHELSALVGVQANSTLQTASRTPSAPAPKTVKPSLSDHIFHQIADGKSIKQDTSKSSPASLLPLDDHDFKAFNG